MFPKFIFSQDMCQVWPLWQGGDAEVALAFFQVPALGTRRAGSAHPPARQMQVALMLMTSRKQPTILIFEVQFLSFSCFPLPELPQKHSPHLFSWYQTKILGSAPEHENVEGESTSRTQSWDRAAALPCSVCCVVPSTIPGILQAWLREPVSCIFL